MPGTERHRCAIVLIAFALQFAAVQVHLLGDHHGHHGHTHGTAHHHTPATDPVSQAPGAHLHGTGDHGHGHDHQNSRHSAQDHAATSISVAPKQLSTARESAALCRATPPVAVPRLQAAPHLAAFAPDAPRATAPPRVRGARAPPMA